jgi:aminoglycoside 6'-N-acetyltransferase I
MFDGIASTLPLIDFIAEYNGEPVGFVEAGVRSHANACDPTHPVGFIEGWFVAESVRRRGIGKALVRAAEDWARTQGCREMASDAEIDNDLSQRVHERLGYAIVDRCADFRKPL